MIRRTSLGLALLVGIVVGVALFSPIGPFPSDSVAVA